MIANVNIPEARNLQSSFKNLKQNTKGDKVIWAMVLLLVLISLLVVYSATGSLAYKMFKGNTEVYLFKQVAFIIGGLLGSKLALILPEATVKKVFAVFMLVMACKLLFFDKNKPDEIKPAATVEVNTNKPV